ncbi:MAG: trypsin-like peptidase domain-containing protein [Actinomycetota bacterium]
MYSDAEPFEPVVVNPPHDEPDSDPTEARPSRARRVGKYVAGGVAVFALSGAGFVAGAQFADDDDPVATQQPVVAPAEDTVAQPEPETAVAAQPAPTAIPDVSGPVAADVEEPVAAVAAAVAPAVVRIDTGSGTGSGVIYTEDGHIITNAHVVGTADEVSIQLADGTRTEGTVIGTDPAVDIAVVQIDSSLDFVVSTFAPTSSVETGQLAVAIGSPFGLEQSVTGGYISAVNRAVPSDNVATGAPTVVEMIQTDAPINPGNSGGALADRQGRIVGINTSIRTDGTTQGNLGVGFAIPSDTALLVAGRIVNGESLESGFLGISGTDPTTGRPGALVTEVVDEGPAQDGGLESGDLIVAINGETVPGMTELAAKVRLSSPGTVIEVEVVRDGESQTLQVTLGTLGEG